MINQPNQQWFEFNDCLVKQFNIKDLNHEAFGGEELHSNLSIGNISKNLKEKIRNAYLLFYQRDKFYDENENPISSLIESNDSKNPECVKKIFKEIIIDNSKYYNNKYLFDHEFWSFIQNMLNSVSNEFEMKNKFLILKLAFFYFFSVIIRSKERELLPNFLNSLKNNLNSNYEISTWFLSQLNEDIIKENIIDSPLKDMRLINFFFIFLNIIHFLK